VASNQLTVSATVFWKDTVAALEALDKVFDRANMYGVRAGGRKAKQAGRRGAPVVSGDLKKSIASSRKLTGSRDEGWSVTVAPHVDYAYSNARLGRGDNTYMEKALAEAGAAMGAAFEKAYARVLAKAGL